MSHHHRGLRRVEASIYSDLNNTGRTIHSSRIYNQFDSHSSHNSERPTPISDEEYAPYQQSLNNRTYSDTASESGDDLREIITIYAGFDAAGAQARSAESGRNDVTSRGISEGSETSAVFLRPSVYTPSNSSHSASSGSSDRQAQIHAFPESKSKQEMQKVGRIMETSDATGRARTIGTNDSSTRLETVHYFTEDSAQYQVISPPLSTVKPPRSINLAADDADDEHSDDDVSSLTDSQGTVVRKSRFITGSSHNLPREATTLRDQIAASPANQYTTALPAAPSTSSFESTGSQETVRTFDVTPSIAGSDVSQSVPELGIAKAIAMHHVLAAEARSSTEYDDSAPSHLQHRALRHTQAISVRSNGSPMLQESESLGDIGEGIHGQRYYARDTDSEVLGSDDLPIIVSGVSTTSSNNLSSKQLGEKTASAPAPQQYRDLHPSKLLETDLRTANSLNRLSVTSQVLRQGKYDTGVIVSVEKDAKEFLMGAQAKNGESCLFNKKTSSEDGSAKIGSSYGRSEASSKRKSSDSRKSRFDQHPPVARPRPGGNPWDGFRTMMGPEGPADRPSEYRGSRSLSARPSYESSTSSGKSKSKSSSDQMKHNRTLQYSQSSGSQASSAGEKHERLAVSLQEEKKRRQLREGARAASPAPSDTSEASVATIKATGFRGRLSTLKLWGNDKKLKHEQSGVSPTHGKRLENKHIAQPSRAHRSTWGRQDHGQLTVPRRSIDTRSVIEEVRSIIEDAQLTFDDGYSSYSDIPSSTGEAIDRAIRECKSNFDLVLSRTMDVTDPTLREMLHGMLLPLATAISNANVARNASLQLEVALGNLALQTSQGVEEVKRRLDAAESAVAGFEPGVQRQ